MFTSLLSQSQLIRRVPAVALGPKFPMRIDSAGSFFSAADRTASSQNSRSFSTTQISHVDTDLKSQLSSQMGVYHSFLGSSNEAKLNRVFQQGLADSLGKFGLVSKELSVEDSWEQLTEQLRNHGETLPPFDPQNTEENIFNLFRFPRPLLSIRGLNFASQQDYITTVTELYWTLAFPNIAFTRAPSAPLISREHLASIAERVGTPAPSWSDRPQLEQETLDRTVFSSEEDALAAILLATPHIHEKTLIHELGCWSGENLVRLLYYTHLQGKTPFAFMGTDIHEIALNIGESTLNYLGIHRPQVQLHLANACHPLDFTLLNISYTQEVKMALKLIPVLTPENAKKFLESARLSFRSPDSILIVSYPILKGKLYELNEERSQTDPQKYQRVPFEGGVIFKTPFPVPEALPVHLKKLQDQKVVINTYYSEEAFNSLADDCGYVVKNSVCVGECSDNYRIVSVLAQKRK